jgi:BirA family biotin operon repressor/biotin-[acetyl-CoA-carboxylase] ligase
MHPRFQLLRLLADGRFHSGEALGAALGVGRSAVWKAARELPALGVEVHAVPGKGYRLAAAFEPLDGERIRAAMRAEPGRLLAGLEVHPSLESTNRYLAQQASKAIPSGTVCLAEHQSRGRGRRGRGWVSPFGANLYASVLWRFGVAPAALGPLSVAVGVAVAEALADVGAQGLGLKWPNDVYWEGRKLAGILIELSGEATGPAVVVAGIGVNANMPPAAGRGIDQPWVDLQTVLGRTVDRNLLATRLLERLLHRLDAFAREGFAPVRPLWERLDLARGREVVVLDGDVALAGECLGIDETGALLVRTGGSTRRCLSGEVSLRLCP